MKRTFCVAAALLLLGVFPALGQDDSTRYIHGIPVSDDDTVRNFPQRDRDPHNRHRPLSVSDLPSGLRKILDEEPQYDGWRDSTVYYEVNTGLYIVPVKYDGGIKIFGLQEDGNAVTYSDEAQ